LIVTTIVNHPLGQYNDPDPVSPVGFDAVLSASFDQANDKGVSIDISSAVTIQYCGESPRPIGTELSGDLSKPRLVAMTFDVNGTAQIANSNATADHIQRSSTPRPETERSGDCAIPEL